MMASRNHYERTHETMKKSVINKFGKHFLLGKDADGVKHYLEQAHWDCDWYWGFGYIHTFTNNGAPEKSRDISSHYHFDSFNRDKDGRSCCMYDGIKSRLVELTVSDKELWTLCELMRTFYIMREYSDLLSRGGAHYTTNPKAELIKNDREYKRINEIVLPKIFDEIEALLSPTV